MDSCPNCKAPWSLERVVVLSDGRRGIERYCATCPPEKFSQFTLKRLIDHWRTEEIVCPYCAHEFTNSWDYEVRPRSETQIQCEECNKFFLAQCEVFVTYTTTILPCLNGEAEHEWSNQGRLKNQQERFHCMKCGTAEWRDKPGADNSLIPVHGLEKMKEPK